MPIVSFGFSIYRLRWVPQFTDMIGRQYKKLTLILGATYRMPQLVLTNEVTSLRLAIIEANSRKYPRFARYHTYLVPDLLRLLPPAQMRC